MYKPKFNQVLVEIDLSDAKWGNSNEEMMGPSYREGKVLSYGEVFPTADYPEYNPLNALDEMIGKQVMWNEGHEAGKTFEDGDKLYALINWWDIVAVKEVKDGQQS